MMQRYNNTSTSSSDFRQSNLSDPAKIILMYLLPEFENPHFSLEDILKFFRVKREKVCELIEELKQRGYLEQMVIRPSEDSPSKFRYYNAYPKPQQRIINRYAGKVKRQVAKTEGEASVIPECSLS